jgi:hypothetical protein
MMGFIPFPGFIIHKLVCVCAIVRFYYQPARSVVKILRVCVKILCAALHTLAFKSRICACGSCGAETLTSLGCEWPQYFEAMQIFSAARFVFFWWRQALIFNSLLTARVKFFRV